MNQRGMVTHFVDDPAYVHTFGLNPDIVHQTVSRMVDRLYPGGLPRNTELGMLNVIRASLYELQSSGWDGDPEEVARAIHRSE